MNKKLLKLSESKLDVENGKDLIVDVIDSQIKNYHQQLFKDWEKNHDLSSVHKKNQIDKLTDRIQGAIKLKFSEFAKTKNKENPAEKVELIVSFLAMLELVKQGIINVTQQNHFDDIEMETESVSIPHYN